MIRRSLLLTLAAALLAGCGRTDAAQSQVVPVRRGDLVFSSSFFGELVARKSESIHTPEFGGWGSYTVATVLSDGTWVKKGDIVLTFARDTIENDLREENAKLAVAVAAYKRKELQLDEELIDLRVTTKQRQLQRDLDQLNVVTGVNLVSKLELEKAKLQLAKSETNLETSAASLAAFGQKSSTTLRVERLEIDQIKTKIKEIEGKLAKLTVRAPKEGVIYGPFTQMNWVRGKCAPGSVTRSGDKLLEIPDFGAYDVKFHVRQRDAGFITAGDTVTVTAAVLPDKELRAVVKKKATFATTRNERTGTSSPEGNLKEIEIVAELVEAPKELRPGGTATVRVDSTLKKGALLVPLAGLEEKDEKYWVAAAGKGEREVKIGKISTTFAEALSGVREGDRIVLRSRP